MILLGALDTQQQNDLSSSFLIPNNTDTANYFNKNFTDDPDMLHYHMNPYWTAIVKVRVVIITRISSPKENASNESDVDYAHSTKIFEFTENFGAMSVDDEEHLSDPDSADDIPDSHDNVLYCADTQCFFTGRFDNKLKRYLDKTVIRDTGLS
jgi:hypothetical protein